MLAAALAAPGCRSARPVDSPGEVARAVDAATDLRGGAAWRVIDRSIEALVEQVPGLLEAQVHHFDILPFVTDAASSQP